MREIEFRGIVECDGRRNWVYGFYLKSAARDGNARHHIVEEDGLTYDIDPETVSQYTGLTDKNGVKIFDGDFVMRRNTESIGIENKILYLVSFENGAFVMKPKDSYYPYRFAYEGYSLHKDYSMLQQFKKEAPWTNGSYEVIGNIHGL